MRASPLSARSRSTGKLRSTAVILQETKSARSFLKQNAHSYLQLRVTSTQPSVQWKQYATPRLAGQMDRVIRLVKPNPSPVQVKTLNREIERMVSLVRRAPRARAWL